MAMLNNQRVHALRKRQHAMKRCMLWQPLGQVRSPIFFSQDSNALQEQLDQIHENLGCLETSNESGAKRWFSWWFYNGWWYFFNLMENDSWCFMFQKDIKELSDAVVKVRFW